MDGHQSEGTGLRQISTYTIQRSQQNFHNKNIIYNIAMQFQHVVYTSTAPDSSICWKRHSTSSVGMGAPVLAFTISKPT
jgi:fumarylacetoacetate (FAA) hydrolase family protein